MGEEIPSIDERALEHGLALLAIRAHRRRGRLRDHALIANETDETHPAHALHGDDDIERAEHGPPALAGAIHPVEPLQPAFGAHGRKIAAEAAGLDLEAQQPKPVAQAAVADELAFRGQEEARAATRHQEPAQPSHALAQPPEARRIEADDDEAAFGHQHALDLA